MIYRFILIASCLASNIFSASLIHNQRLFLTAFKALTAHVPKEIALDIINATEAGTRREKMFNAFRAGNNALGQELFQEGGQQSIDADETSALTKAARHGKFSLVKFLLKTGAVVNQPGFEGCTALHEAILNHQHSITEYLTDQHADLNAQDTCGRTPLVSAVNAENHAALRWLLLHNVPMHTKDTFGRTALTYAQQKHNNYAQQLLSRKMTGMSDIFSSTYNIYFNR